MCLTNNYHGVGFLVRYYLFVLAAAQSERSNRKRIQQKRTFVAVSTKWGFVAATGIAIPTIIVVTEPSP